MMLKQLYNNNELFPEPAGEVGRTDIEQQSIQVYQANLVF